MGGPRKRYGTTTITLSIPVEIREFYDELANDGYNRSYLMLGMSAILRNLYKRHEKFPGGLPAAIRLLREETSNPNFFARFGSSHQEK